MHRSLLSLVAVVALAGCASTGGAPAPERFHFDFKFLGGGQACQVTATDLRSKEELFVQAALPRDRRDGDASYENGDTGQILEVKLVHEDSGKHLCTATVTERGKLIASDRREQ